MTNLIKLLPGSVVDVKGHHIYSNGTYICTRVNTTQGYWLIKTDELEGFNIFIKDLSSLSTNLTRKGYAGPRIVDDYVCHDHRCFPKSITGCSGCHYQGNPYPNYFWLGEYVWDKVWKKRHKVIAIELFFDIRDLDLDPDKIPEWEIRRIKEIGDFLSPELHREYYQILYEAFGGLKPVFLYTLAGFTRKSKFEFHELTRAGKRTGYIPDLEQTKYICSELCIYGKGSLKCFGCPTRDFIDELKPNLENSHDL